MNEEHAELPPHVGIAFEQQEWDNASVETQERIRQYMAMYGLEVPFD